MDVKLLRDIKETEEKSRQLIYQAEKKRQETIEKAKLDGIRKYEEFLRSLEAVKEQKLSEKRSQLRKQKKAILAANDRALQELQDSVSSRADRAVLFIIEQFKKAV